MKLLRRLWSFFPWALLGFSLALHFVSIVLYLRLPIRFAAFTVFPVWVWGSLGLALTIFVYLFFRKPGSLALSVVWLLTILFLSDEARSLGRLSLEPLERGPAPSYAGSKVLRVATLNCQGSQKALEDLGLFVPDIILLQEMPNPYLLKKFTEEVFDGQGDYCHHPARGCAVLVRGTIHHNIAVPGSRSQLVAVELPNGRQIELLNIHLQSAATNLHLYRRQCWWEHRQNRTLREVELAYALAGLDQLTSFPRVPALVAGDFNAPANDSVYRMLQKTFTDAFGTVGTGWGNTYHSSLPLLRIDQIYCSEKLLPVRSQAFTTDASDHRLVIADFVYR